ncbi:hypothetical protein ACUXCC_002595 [Cytobacillus horneckiae]|uniref:hypothetical protein n=1 Tax=Cytobacillus horneckiae TaxID=549687 RepID=UPI0019D25FC9|nr:hypothetical protein [Cytobacillus horneckiae]MBN6887508.1 hypothetical protein [Cytobacillus horneckiae]
MYFNAPTTHIQYQQYAERNIGYKYNPFFLTPLSKISIHQQPTEQGEPAFDHKLPVQTSYMKKGDQSKKPHREAALISGKGRYVDIYI